MPRLLMAVVLAASWFAFSAHAECQAPGLIGEYFSLDDLVSDFPLLPPEHRPDLKRVDANINFNWVKGEFYGTPWKERFYVRWSGWIKIPKSGQYTFYTESDDGSRLFIDDREVVDNYGLHGMQEEEGTVALKSGRHRIQADFIQYDGGAGCICPGRVPRARRKSFRNRY